jgi:AcrR family transcriptional regulator
VGSGTLYRNFPTREVLIEAAYRNEVAKLCDATPGLLATLPPREALRAWMDRFLDYATAKIGMAEALRAVIASGGDPYGDSRELLLEALSSLQQPGRPAREPHRHLPRRGRSPTARAGRTAPRSHSRRAERRTALKSATRRRGRS